MTREQKKEWAIRVSIGVAALGVGVLATSKFGPSISIAGNKNQIVMGSVITIVKNGGYMRKIVRCVETDQMWPSVTQAAEHAKVPISLMSNHLNGRTEAINDLHYVIEGLAAG